jgi:hypothetical protein
MTAGLVIDSNGDSQHEIGIQNNSWQPYFVIDLPIDGNPYSVDISQRERCCKPWRHTRSLPEVD